MTRTSSFLPRPAPWFAVLQLLLVGVYLPPLTRTRLWNNYYTYLDYSHSVLTLEDAGEGCSMNGDHGLG